MQWKPAAVEATNEILPLSTPTEAAPPYPPLVGLGRSEFPTSGFLTSSIIALSDRDKLFDICKLSFMLLHLRIPSQVLGFSAFRYSQRSPLLQTYSHHGFRKHVRRNTNIPTVMRHPPNEAIHLIVTTPDRPKCNTLPSRSTPDYSLGLRFTELVLAALTSERKPPSEEATDKIMGPTPPQIAFEVELWVYRFK